MLYSQKKENAKNILKPQEEKKKGKRKASSEGIDANKNLENQENNDVSQPQIDEKDLLEKQNESDEENKN